MIGAKGGDVRVRRLLDQRGVKYQVLKDGDFRTIFDVGDGRSQVGFVCSNTYSLSSLEIREVFSIGYECEGPLPASVANTLLHLNTSMKLGAWRTLRLEDGRHLAAFAAQIAANTDADTLLTTILMVLKTADEVERSLTGGDRF